MKTKKIASDFVWNMVGITLNSVYSIILILFITRYATNGIEYAGQFSYVFYISSLFSTIGNYGGRILQISDVKNKYSNENYISLRYISDILMLFILIIFVILNKYNFEKIVLLFIMIIYRAFEAISDSYYGVMQKNDNLTFVGKSMTFKSVSSIFLFIILYIMFNNLIIASLSFVFSFLISLIFMDKYYCKKNYNIRKIKITSKTFKILKESFMIFLFSFLTLLIANLTRYFVDLRLTDFEQGYYSIIVLPASLVTLFAQFLIQPYLNYFVNLNSENKFKDYQKKSNILLLCLYVIGIVISLIMYVFGTKIIEIVYNIDLKKYYIYISLLVMSGICNGAVIIISNLLTVMKKIKIQLLLFILPIIFIIIFSILNVNSLNVALNTYIYLMFIEFILFFTYYNIYLIKKGRKMINE